MDSEIMLSNLGEALEGLVIRENTEGGTPQTFAEALDAPDDAASLEIERCLVALRLEGSAADENCRAD